MTEMDTEIEPQHTDQATTPITQGETEAVIKEALTAKS
jgi:hypothetical protein